MSVFILIYSWLWHEHTVDTESQVLLASWNFDKKENMLDHKLSNVRTFAKHFLALGSIILGNSSIQGIVTLIISV